MSPIAILPELLLPAGGFDSGVAAFEGGADAVYLGFQSFSARKQARNFGEDEYRRLLSLARTEGKKIYVAVNTVLAPRDEAPLAGLLAFLEAYRPDGLIFQDWGLARLLAGRLPGLPLHASTQTAIQTPAAARLALEAGVSRVVLPRETTIEGLAAFHREVPELEFEVFVHGALCYSYSGLCLASGILLGRSGNRGECAQVCRSWYRHAEGGEDYAFSCRDLSLVDRLGALAEAGAVSLKVEGRMKSPEYVHAVARLYRAALDSSKEGAPKVDLSELEREARMAFSRSPSLAYSGDPRGEDLVDPRFPGHRGIALGRVLGRKATRITVELDSLLGLRDGVLALPVTGTGEGRVEGEAFSVQELADARSGKPLVTARAGSRVEFNLPPGLPSGIELRRISARDMDRRAVNPLAYEPRLRRLAAKASLDGAGRLSLSVELPPRAGRPEAVAVPVTDEEALPLARGKTPGGFRKVLDLLAESGEASFRLEARLDEDASRKVEGEEVDLADLFVPPSLLKKAKNRLYEKVAALLEAEDEAERAYWLAALGSEAEEAELRAAGLQALPPRALVGFAREDLSTRMPFALPRTLRRAEALPEWEGWLWLPLAPVVADWPAYEAFVVARVEGLLAEGKKLMIGVDGLHHAVLARRLRSLHPDAEGLGFFGDIHLYAATQGSRRAWKALVPGLGAIYPWVEAGAPGEGEPVFEGFEPPLFISKGCYLRHARSGGSCPPACPRSYSEELSDRDRRYTVIVEDCVTMLFRSRNGDARVGRP